MKTTEKVKNKKMKTEWDLGKLFYKNGNDPKIELDLAEIVSLCEQFEKKYRNETAYLENEEALYAALQECEALTKKIASSKPVLYFSYRLALNTADKEAEGKAAKYGDILIKAHTKTIFFDLSLGKIQKEDQEKFLKSERLSDYRYLLKKIFENAKYDLTEPEEKILNFKSVTSRGMWIDGVEKLQNKQTVHWEGKNIPLSEARELVAILPTKKRRTLHRLIMEKLRDAVSDFAESEINAVYTDKKIGDELRGFKEPYSATILGYENDEKSILNLVSAVTDAFPVSQKFYTIKARLLKEKALTYADRGADVGKTKAKFPIENGITLVTKIFEDAGPQYKEIFERMLANGQTDFFPKQNKRSGAFCSGEIESPTLVLLNYTDSLRSVETLAHEMGHAVHTEMSKKQRPIYQNYSTAVAETASTFFEGLVFEEVFKTLSDKEKIVALHDKIQGDIASIFRQVACFNFELELHKKIREEGFVQKEDIAKLLNKHMSAYLGKTVKMEDVDGYFFTSWSHIRNFFYVYSYAYGQLISRALCEEYKKDHTFIEKITEFLSAGGSASPEDIFKRCGITTDKEFFKKGIQNIARDIDELDKLSKK
jgi:oligoendopeptidase F